MKPGLAKDAESQSLSFVCGATDEPLSYQTVGGVLEAAARRWPDRDALVVAHQGVHLTYRELNARAEAVAGGLLSLGLEPGDRIGIWAPNCVEWVVLQFATAKAGLILVNINPAYRLAEVEYALAKVGCRALAMADRFKTSDYTGMMSTLVPEAATCGPGAWSSARLPALQWLIHFGTAELPGFLRFEEVSALGGDAHVERLSVLRGVIQADDAVNIQFTSGTTGQPKGATLTHFNIVNNGFFVGTTLSLTERDRVCIPVPLYHCFGMVMGNLACVTHGAAMVYPNDGFDAQATLETVARERCTVLYGVPTMFVAQLEHASFAQHDLSSLRTGIMAGAPCPIEVMRQVVTRMSMPEVTIAYGMTETSPVSFQTSVTDPMDVRVATVGRVHPHVQVKIVDGDSRIVPRGRTGELCTRGYSVMRGYWGDEEQTRQVIDAAGWMHTGDLAAMDARGYCNIHGRLKELIIRGGEQLSPREIEEFLYRHPAVEIVQVFGVPDHRYGEEICAWIKLRGCEVCTEREIREFCRDQIAHQKVPRYVRFVTEFPMTVTGKIQKFVMRQRMVEELDLRAEDTA